MVLTETHLHTSEVSVCGSIPAVEIPHLYRDAGYGAIIVTDHFNKCTLDRFGSGTRERIEGWLQGYRIVRSGGESLGLKVFLGMELCLCSGPEEYLLYGFGEEFLYAYPELYRMSLRELFSVAEAEGLLLYQAHPFRSYLKCQDPGCMHGVEVFNGNMRHDSHNDKAMAHARNNGLRMIAGSDFHEYEDLGRGGIYIPQRVSTNAELAAYLRKYRVRLFMAAPVRASNKQQVQ